MPRTLSAELENAIDTGTINAYIKAVSGAVTTNVLKYKLTGTELSLTTQEILGNTVKLRRGTTLNGVDYYVETSTFYIKEKSISQYQGINQNIKAEATIFPTNRVAMAGDDTYENIITAFCALFSKTAVFRDPSAAFWQYQFLPTGKQVITNNAMNFLAMLRQKYFIFAADNGDEEVLFYHALSNETGNEEYSIWHAESQNAVAGDIIAGTPIEYHFPPYISDQRTFIARDEAQSLRTGGTADKPYHNLGYLESTDSFPALSTQPIKYSWEMGIQLKPLSGDVIMIDPDNIEATLYPAEIIEELDIKSNISWKITIKQQEIFSNTEGGSLPSTIERVSNYTPLNTSTFDNNLDASINNLQALAEAVDELVLGSTTEETQDIVGTMFSGNTETGITATYQDSDGTIDLVLDDEYIQDLIGGMVSGNSETNITVTYDDTNGKLDFNVTGGSSGFDLYGHLNTY